MTDTTSDAMLLPCPFCGGKADFQKVDMGFGKYKCRVKCDPCGVLPLWDTRESAAQAWNTRAAARPAGGEREAIEEAIFSNITRAMRVDVDFVRNATDSILALITRPAGAGEVVAIPADALERACIARCWHRIQNAGLSEDELEGLTPEFVWLSAEDADGNPAHDEIRDEVRSIIAAAMPLPSTPSAPSGRDPATIEAVGAIRRASAWDNKNGC